jgi:glycerol-3-phosphate acyltransferase PlsY
LFAISPWLGLIAFGIFVVMFFIFRYVSLSSMVCMFLPAFMVFVPHISYLYLFRYSLWYPHDAIIQIWLMCMILYNSLIVIIRHKSNIQRLLKHEEKRFF